MKHVINHRVRATPDSTSWIVRLDFVINRKGESYLVSFMIDPDQAAELAIAMGDVVAEIRLKGGDQTP